MEPAIPARPRSWLPLWLFGILLACAAIIWKLELTQFNVSEATQDLGEYVSRYTSPSFQNLPEYLGLMFQTVAIALWGSGLAFVAAILTCIFATVNLSPHPVVYRLAREVFSFLRAVPDLAFAVLFIMSFGIGPQSGVCALALHGIGFLGKSFAESLERVDFHAYEGLASVGAGRWQSFVYAGLPSVQREVVGATLYTFDRNVRMAAVLGIVGAGGIGVPLKEAVDLFRYSDALAILIVILVALLVIEFLSDSLRRRLN